MLELLHRYAAWWYETIEKLDPIMKNWEQKICAELEYLAAPIIITIIAAIPIVIILFIITDSLIIYGKRAWKLIKIWKKLPYCLNCDYFDIIEIKCSTKKPAERACVINDVLTIEQQ